MNFRAALTGFPHPLRAAAWLLLVAGALRFAQPLAMAQSDGEIAAVSSKVSGGYSRVRLPDGSFRAETYTFGEGGRMAGSARDDTVDAMTFMDVASVVAGPLEKLNYVPV